MKNLFILLLTISLFSCNKAKETAKETINKSGETVGKSATEFINGVSNGVDKSLECEVILSKKLTLKGLKTGKCKFENDSLNTNNNKIIVYFIFDMDIKESISVKVFDINNLEIGRSSIEISGKMGEAKYYDVLFDKRTNIESKSKITVE